VLVFGGGDVGEGISKPDGHRDGAILSLRTKRWTRIADAPYPMAGPTGVWTGSEVVMIGGEPRCSNVTGTRECRDTVTRAAVYNPSTDAWRRLKVPARFRSPAQPLGWTGREAWFLLSGHIVGVTPEGSFRRLTSLPEGLTTDAVCGTGSVVAVGTRIAVDQTALSLYNPRTDTWTSASAEPPLPVSSLLCTNSNVIVIPTATTLSDLSRYDTRTRQWAAVPAAALPRFVPCTVTSVYGTCDVPRGTTQGRYLDVWLAGKDGSGQRYDPSTNRWSAIAIGPDSPALGGPWPFAWIDSLAVTLVATEGLGSAAGSKLVVYRPGR
jgi:hypothetical protein